MTKEQEVILFLKELNRNRATGLIKNKINETLSLIQEQQAKIEKKDKIIDRMAEHIGQDIKCIRPEIECNKMTYDCKECVKQYFEDKATQEEN